MKKIFLVAFGAMLLFTACKKDYSCTCEYIIKEGGETGFEQESFSIEGATKDQAQAACLEAKLKMEMPYYSYERTCKLKK